MFKRGAFHTLLKRMEEPRRFIQVLAGPRQTGKTTIARQVAEAVSFPVGFASADEPTLRDRNWVIQQWETAKVKRQLVVGQEGIDLEEFLTEPLERWIS